MSNFLSSEVLICCCKLSVCGGKAAFIAFFELRLGDDLLYPEAKSVLSGPPTHDQVTGAERLHKLRPYWQLSQASKAIFADWPFEENNA